LWFMFVYDSKGRPTGGGFAVGGYGKHQITEVIAYIKSLTMQLNWQPIWFDTVEESDQFADSLQAENY
jgi:hypothetical protein